MIEIGAIRAAARPGEAVHLDRSGRLIDGAAADLGSPATVFVAEMTDAVKLVEGGFVTASVDRDLLWRVEGFLIAPEVLADLPENLMGVGELFAAVRSVGYRWRVQMATSSSP